MASKLKINKDFNYRASLTNTKVGCRIRSLLLNDLYLPIEARQYLLRRRVSNVYSSKVHNRCIITGRTKAVYSYLKLTRMMFKNLAVRGCLAGIKKYSW